MHIRHAFNGLTFNQGAWVTEESETRVSEADPSFFRVSADHDDVCMCVYVCVCVCMCVCVCVCVCVHMQTNTFPDLLFPLSFLIFLTVCLITRTLHR